MLAELLPGSKLELFVRSVSVASYLPGRIRLYAKKLVGNAPLEKKVQDKLRAFAEISAVTTNNATGSILIEYDPDVLRRNEELKRIEDYIIKKARRK